MVYRVYVEKKKDLAHEAMSLLNDARTLLGIAQLTDVRVINRYDAENITEELFDYAKNTVFSEQMSNGFAAVGYRFKAVIGKEHSGELHVVIVIIYVVYVYPIQTDLPSFRNQW
jgi:hypothetical protein